MLELGSQYRYHPEIGEINMSQLAHFVHTQTVTPQGANDLLDKLSEDTRQICNELQHLLRLPPQQLAAILAQTDPPEWSLGTGTLAE